MECFYGYLVAVLSTIVTLLLGWQIYSAWKLEKRFKEITEKLTKQYTEDAEKRKYDAVGMSLAQLGLSLYHSKNYGSAVLILINALSSLNKGFNDDYNAEATNNATRMLAEIASIKNIQLSNTTENEKSFYLDVASKVKDIKEKEIILKFIMATETTI